MLDVPATATTFCRTICLDLAILKEDSLLLRLLKFIKRREILRLKEMIQQYVWALLLQIFPLLKRSRGRSYKGSSCAKHPEIYFCILVGFISSHFSFNQCSKPHASYLFRNNYYLIIDLAYILICIGSFAQICYCTVSSWLHSCVFLPTLVAPKSVLTTTQCELLLLPSTVKLMRYGILLEATAPRWLKESVGVG